MRRSDSIKEHSEDLPSTQINFTDFFKADWPECAFIEFYSRNPALNVDEDDEEEGVDR